MLALRPRRSHCAPRVVALFLHLLAITLPRPAYTGNPLVPNVGMADPHVRVVKKIGKDIDETLFYLFATHDFSPNNTDFLMKNWWAWASTDLVHWTKEVVIAPNASFLAWDPNADECWATDAILRNGRWFWYLSVSPSAIGVVTSMEIAGPWEDPLGKPLLGPDIANRLNPPALFRDPGIFVDVGDSSDQAYSRHAHYIVAGVFDYYIARLGDDMISLAEQPRHLIVDPNNHSAWGPYGKKTDDKPYIHKHDGNYYLSWGCFYGTSQSVYGPFLFQGEVIATPNLSKDFRMPHDPKLPFYAQEDLADRHGSFFEAYGQWYFATNDRSHSKDKRHPDVYRDTVVGYVHYRADGTIAPVRIDAVGVGTYDAALGRIQAENYFRREGSGMKKVDIGGDNFVVHIPGRSNGSLFYPLVQNTTDQLVLALHAPPIAADGNELSATNYVHIAMNSKTVGDCDLGTKNPSGKVLCPLSIPEEGSKTNAVNISLTFIGRSVEIDWFEFVTGKMFD